MNDIKAVQQLHKYNHLLSYLSYQKQQSENMFNSMSQKITQVQDQGTSILYQKRFLTEDNNNANYFLKSIAYDVKMKDLIRVVKTCAYHSEMPYCPVILEIKHPQLKQIFGGEYLLQVYNMNGESVFDKVLKYDVVSWNIFYEYFVFKLDEREDDSGWFYVVQIKDRQITCTKIKDIFKDNSYRHMGLCSKNLFIANDTQIKILSFKEKGGKENEVVEFVPTEKDFATYALAPSTKLHGFFENRDSRQEEFLLLILENSQHIIDFAKMKITEGGEPGKPNIQFHQYREVVHQANVDPNDYVDDFKMYINIKTVEVDPKERQNPDVAEFKDIEQSVGASRRVKGKVDFYFDYELIDQSTQKFARLEVTTRYIYIQKQDASAKQNNTDEETDQSIACLEIDMEACQRIGETVGETRDLDPEKWDYVVFDKIRNYARIFSSITLININFFIAFNRVVCINDVVARTWTFQAFDKKVSGLLRNEANPAMQEMNVGVLLENGQIKMIDKQETEEWILKETNIQVAGTVLKVVSDWRDISSHYILHAPSKGKRSLSLFQRTQITNLDTKVQMTDDEELIRAVTANEQEDFLLLNRKLGIIRTFCNDSRKKGNKKSDEILIFQNRKIKIHIPKPTEAKPGDAELKENNITKLGKKEFHTAVGSKDHDYIILFNKNDVIKCKIEFKEQSAKDKKEGITHRIYQVEVKNDYNIMSLQVIDSEYCYSLSNFSSNQGRPGFYIQSIDTFTKAQNKQTGNFRLKPAIVGQNDLLDYYKDDQRLAYISSYDCIRIVPLLHRSTLGFIGMRPRKEYLSFRKFKDKFMALDKFGNITTWNVLTGKIDPRSQALSGLENKSQLEPFTGYEIFRNNKEDNTYRSEWYQQCTLLINLKNPVNMDEVQFFGDRLKNDFGVNSSFVSTVDKKFYKFRLIEIKDNQEVKEHFSFVHPFYEKQFHRLFFNDELDHMIERHEQNVFIYKRQNKPRDRKDFTTTGTQEVTWVLLRRIQRFPHDLANITFVNYLFSPNFMFYLDFNKNDNHFVIKNTLDQTDYVTIPKGIMHPGDGKDISLIGKKFQWLDNSTIRLINDDGIEKTVDITKNCEQISYCSVPMLDIEYLKSANSSHYFYDVSITRENQTIERLKRKYQEYFTAYYSGGVRAQNELYDLLFSVDFNIDNCRGKIVADTSFTYFHLKIAELMESMPRFNIKRYHPEEIKILALNIFPRGKTLLHYAYQNLNIVRRFYKVIDQEAAKLKEDRASKDQDVITNQGQFEIPFMRNFDGKTALHLCLIAENFKSADIILSKLCNDPLDSHARAINDIIPELVAKELPSVGNYLDSRFAQTILLKDHFRRGTINKQDDLSYGLTTAELWPDKHKLKEKIFKEEKKADTEIKVEFLDVVGVHTYTEDVGAQFFDGLAETGDASLFSHRSVQAIIDFKWPLAREYTIKVLFIPFCIYLAVFVTWSNVFNNFVYPLDERSWFSLWAADKVLCAILYFFSVYFLSNELRQIYHSGIGYFSQIWNYVDFIPSILIICIVSIKLRIQYYEKPEDNHINLYALVSFHSLASFLMWIKLLYFMRIFNETGYLVKIITVCIQDMQVFLIIFLTVIVAFNEAFLRIAEGSDDMEGGGKFQGKNYAQGFAYTFALAVGDTRADGYDDSAAPAVVWIIFSLVLLIMNVVMLNLLVAIVSKSFENIHENSESAMYQERASIISENSYLIPWYRKKQHCINGTQYLVIARDILDEDNDQGGVEMVQNKIIELEGKLADFHKEYQESHEEFSNNISQKLDEIQGHLGIKKAA